ncbi:MAG TPA: ATP-binding protein, partial [Candidatus Paceibacterota bacterium]|nr:ATP-binding protein [Candidatus Paceibacterota bacterium]
MDDETIIKNAIEFIKESSLFKSNKYNLLKPLMEKVLNDTYTEEDIKKFVDFLIPSDEKSVNKKENLKEIKQAEESVENSAQKEELRRIKSIKEIKCIQNVGLIDKIESIKLNSGINFFYGLNASGKSSLYKAICNVLGYKKETLANINEDSNVNIPKCYLEVEDLEGNTCEIGWQNGVTKPKLNVRIFDSDISLSLVKDDQDNTFSLAHLKQEYFQLLSEFLENLGVRLNEKKNNLTLKFNLQKENLQSKLPFLFKEGEEIKEENVKDVRITKKERDNLKKIQKEYEELQKINFDDKIKILNNFIAQMEEILKIFGERVEKKKELVWEYLFTHEYLEKINNSIADYIACKKLLDNERTIQLKDYIPENWLKSDTWKRFIDSSFDFVRDLSETQQKEYLEKKCPYCHQVLLDRAKKIIESYKILQGETKQKMTHIDLKLSGYLDKIKKVLLDLKEIPKKEKKIVEEIKEFSIKKTYNIDLVMDIFTRLKEALISKNKFSYSQVDIDKIKALFDYYLSIYDGGLEKNKIYEKKNRNKENNINGLETKIQPLKHKNEIVNNKEDLLKCIKLSKALKKIESIAGLIIEAKTFVS